MEGVEVLPPFVTAEVLAMVAVHVVIAHGEGGHPHHADVAYHLHIVVVEATADHHHIVMLAVSRLMLMEIDAGGGNGANRMQQLGL